MNSAGGDMTTEQQEDIIGEGMENGRSQMEREQDDHQRELDARNEEIAALKGALAEREGEIAALRKAEEDYESRIAVLNDSLAQTAAGYKALAVASLPGVTAEMVAGSTAGEIEKSLENVRAIVERVRQEVEAEASRTRVPAGAPQRGTIDYSGLSAREKIQFAVGGNR